MISKRLLFLTLASVDTTAIALTNVVFELLAEPKTGDVLRQEWQTVIPDTSKIDNGQLKGLRIMDSLMKESQRMYPMGLGKCCF